MLMSFIIQEVLRAFIGSLLDGGYLFEEVQTILGKGFRGI